MRTRQTAPAGAFALSPVPQMAKTLLFLLVLLPASMSLAVLGLFLHQASGVDTGVYLGGIDARLLTLPPLGLGLVMLVALGSCWWLWRDIERRGVALAGDSLDVHTPLAHRRIGLAELDLARARVVNLDEQTELKPMLRLRCIYLPGLRSGWLLLRNRRRTLVSTTGGRRVLWLPTRGKFDLLLELQQPQAALDALRARAA